LGIPTNSKLFTLLSQARYFLRNRVNPRDLKSEAVFWYLRIGFIQFRIFFLVPPSRFGSFEILAVNNEMAELKQLADFVLEVNFPHLLAHADSREVRYPIKSFRKSTLKI
jgi:hypothetical protein